MALPWQRFFFFFCDHESIFYMADKGNFFPTDVGYESSAERNFHFFFLVDESLAN